MEVAEIKNAISPKDIKGELKENLYTVSGKKANSFL